MVQPLIAFILLLFLMASWHRVELMKMHERKCWWSRSFALLFWAETGANRYRRSYHCAVHTRTTHHLLFSLLHRVIHRRGKKGFHGCAPKRLRWRSLFSWLVLLQFARPQGRGSVLTRNHFHFDTHRSGDNCYYEAPPNLDFYVFLARVFFRQVFVLVHLCFNDSFYQFICILFIGNQQYLYNLYVFISCWMLELIYIFCLFHLPFIHRFPELHNKARFHLFFSVVV